MQNILFSGKSGGMVPWPCPPLHIIILKFGILYATVDYVRVLLYIWVIFKHISVLHFLLGVISIDFSSHLLGFRILFFHCRLSIFPLIYAVLMVGIN